MVKSTRNISKIVRTILKTFLITFPSVLCMYTLGMNITSVAKIVPNKCRICTIILPYKIIIPAHIIVSLYEKHALAIQFL